MIDFNEEARRAFEYAEKFNEAYNISYIGTEQLMLGILAQQESQVAQIMSQFGIDYETYEKLVIGVLNPSEKIVGQTPRTKSVVKTALEFANTMEDNYIGLHHLAVAILNDSDSVATLIISRRMGVNINYLINNIINANNGNAYVNLNEIPDLINEFFKVETDMPKNTKKNSGNQGGITSKIDKFGEDLTLKAKQGKIDPVIGRSAEIERIIQVLCRKTKNNPVLVGEPGTGKSAVVEGLALKIASNDVPELLKGKTIFSLNIGNLLAGTKYRGEFEENFKSVIDEIKNNKDIILYIDEIHNIVGAGSTSESSMDAGEMLKPMLSRGEMQTIGATTLEEYRKYIEKDGALERRFQPIKVEPPTVEETILILKGIKDKYEAHHGVLITDEAITAAAVLSDRYITDRFLPDKAIDLIDEACSRARLQSATSPNNIKQLEEELEKVKIEIQSLVDKEDYVNANKYKERKDKLIVEIQHSKDEWQAKNGQKTSGIGEEEIAEIVSNWTAIPVKRLTEEEGQRLLTLESFLHKRVIGQEEAVSSISRAIRRARAGLKDPKRPIGSFIFVGPTGVGKTELTKALAEAMFGDENLMIRLDMSEYMEPHAVSKLIGAPPGYVGFDGGGQLTEKVRRKPYSVILFDEIEKAHPDVFNILLQILDDGRLSDSQGRVVDFKNTIIILTSNIGSRIVGNVRKLGFSDGGNGAEYDNMKDNIMNELKKSFRPEFLNRLDDIIVFHKLDKQACAQIAKIMIQGLSKRMEEKGLKINVEDDAIDYLVNKGFDEEYGARPLRRIIQKELEDNLAESILANKITFADKVNVSVKNNVLFFENFK